MATTQMTLVEQIRAGTADDDLSAIVVAVYDRQHTLSYGEQVKQHGEGKVLAAMYEEVGLI